MKNILWLVSWYPNRVDNYDGDFIQRHARAVSGFGKLDIIYVKKDEKLEPGTCERTLQDSGTLKEQVIYYNSRSTGIKLIDKFLSQQAYNQHMRSAIKDYIHERGKPALVHVHVAMKAGMAAFWMKRKWGIPYIISEHWTAYLKDADKQIGDYPFLHKKMLQQVLQNAAALTVVSQHLGKAIQMHVPGIQYQVVPNVVDTNIFYPQPPGPEHVARFIHVSNMNYQKNTEAILKALHILKAKQIFEMYLYGPVSQPLEKLIKDYELEARVFAMGEHPQPVLANMMRRCDALVLYSRFETFGCVLIEANACGIPVIVSNLQVFHELVEEGVNGRFVKGDDPDALAQCLENFITKRNNFDKDAIATAAAEKYNYGKVGMQFLQLYELVG